MKSRIFLQRYEENDFMYGQMTIDGGYIYQKKAEWASEGPAVKNFKEMAVTVLFHIVTSLEGNRFVYRTLDEDVLVQLYIARTGIVAVEVASRTSIENAIDHVKLLQEKLTVVTDPGDKDISVAFWHLAPNGPRSMVRKIEAPKWEDIKMNYPGETQKGLDSLMTTFRPERGGQLILLHGNPGAGKTYSLRALCQAWKPWASIQYILDPEQLFGGSAYFSSLIMDEDTSYASRYEDDEDEENEKQEAPKWRLLILEDTGELLSEDARARSGQGLSRLLNLVDGFIGQGLRVLVLITTNEEIGKLHPAISREGRCAAAIEFKEFTFAEASKWATAHDIQITKDKNYTLADLYAIYKDTHSIRVTLDKSNPLGFRMPVASA